MGVGILHTESSPSVSPSTDGMRTSFRTSVRSRNSTGLPAIRKIPPELRRRKPVPPPGLGLVGKTLWRLKEDSQFLRSTVQFAFIALCLWIGFEFYLFMRWENSGGALEFHPRPPGAEGFLPISALISIKYWTQSGIINGIHPSGLFILVAIVAIGFLFKKAFCSWMCPIGTISESLWLFGRRLFGRNLRITKWPDRILRSVKYLLLLFFMISIWQMDIPGLKAFIESPYNRMADIKMYLFFADISTFALWTIVILVVLSVVIENFWCRYLCPYGALLGAASLLSPLKVTRNASTCIDCELCTKECPAGIAVHRASRVRSDECTGCFACVEACPVKNTLDIRVTATDTRVPSWAFGLLVVLTFVGITGLAMLTGHWQNAISREEYLRRYQNIDSPLYEHNRGHVLQDDAPGPAGGSR